MPGPSRRAGRISAPRPDAVWKWFEDGLAYLDADLAEPERILTSSELRDTLDLTRPVALGLISVVHFLPDSADPHGLVRRYLDELPSGSYLALTHLTADFAPDEIWRMAAVYGQRGVVVNPRPRAAVERFFDGLELVEPGVQAVRPLAPAGRGRRGDRRQGQHVRRPRPQALIP
ncbi:SAM-dependent methyltransferase [Parafrankia discariae]|uniref:SAM-dependent methyltransferase n=1 Tax=Parafrankia discariae TaxID=365528 RepID=UPI0003A8D7A9|nr:SAM-dependent methyltransferase [Parafrankia discariae]